MPRRPLPPSTRVCLLPACGVMFTLTRKTQVYCTSAHYRADRHRRRVLRLAERQITPPTGVVCALDGCEASARGLTGMDRFCTERHYMADWRFRSGRSVKLDPKDCLYPPCGASFQPRSPSQLYCAREHKVADRYRRNPQTYLASEKRKRESDPEFARAKTERARQWVKDNPELARAHFRRSTLKRRGVTPEGYDALLAEFSGACWICGERMAETTPTGRTRSLHVDHDHAHAAGDPAGVRGLLDTWCNTRLAIVENTELVEQVRRYLESRSTYLPPPAHDGDSRRGGRWRNFRLTEQQYEAMVTACGDRCELCGEPERVNRHGARRPLSVDHDHSKDRGEPGFIRGLLCNGCNSAVGVVEKADWFERARSYLVWAPPRAQALQRRHPLPVGRRYTRAVAPE